MTGSLDRSINMLVKQYSSLFTLPTMKKIMLYLLTLTLIDAIFSCLALKLSISSLILGIGTAAGFFSIILLTDLFVSKTSMKNDVVFNFRRCSALSLFSNLVWSIFIIIGSLLTFSFNSETIWIKFFLLGFCAAIISRLIVFLTISMKNNIFSSFSAVFQPLVCFSLFLLILQMFTPLNLFSVILFLGVAIPIIFAAAFLFVFLVDIVGKDSPLHFSSFSLFKAFMANWTEDLNEPLERIFEQLGEERDVEVDVLVFKGRNAYKAALVVPSFHPGPFKNVGSSPIPYLIQRAVSEKLKCPVAVPHGLFGHELDLASQMQNERVLDAILSSLSPKSFFSEASPMVRVSKENASATCQVFGNCALLTLTLAPKTTEDFPKEIGEHISEYASKLGLQNFIVINAHNSIDSLEQSEEEFKLLKSVASQSLEEALKNEPKQLRVGAAKLNPVEYGIQEGMGPGGIVALTFEVNGKKYAYAVFDGNNMISGLREKILDKLRDFGIAEGEVMTSDTHVVNGVVLNKRGYHPIGEVMNHEKVIEMVMEVVSKALERMEPASVGWQTIKVPAVKVIGERQIEIMGDIAHKAATRAKKAALTIFPIIGLILISLLTIV